ncbi:MAG: hypothetical protein WC236_09805 [Gallionellaceae bacterium]|jgi:hypothetical protein
MSEHTKECWEHGGTAVESKDDLVRIFGESIDTHVGELGQYFMEIFTEEGARIAFLAGPTSHANARRIVACVNACEGIPTDALEQPRSIADKIESVSSELLAIKRSRDALEIIAVCTAGALDKAGFTEIDNPADAIEMLVQQRDELRDVLQFILRGMDGGHIKCAPYFDFDPDAENIEFKHPADMIRSAIAKASA